MDEQAKESVFVSLDEKVNHYLGLCSNCAQTSFIVLQEQFDLGDGGDAVLKALTAFPGIALRGETCGAVTGSLMALGMLNGRDREHLNSFRHYQKSLPSARRFCSRFEDEVGSTRCDDILEAKFGRRFNLADPVEAMQYASAGAYEKCGEVIRTSVRIAADIIMK